MTPRPKRRTLAERDAQAIQTPPAPPRKKAPRPRGLQRGVLEAKSTTATTPTRTTKATKRKSAAQRRGAPATGRVIVNIWIDRTLWAQAKTLYLRAHPGHEVALVEWVDDIVNAYLDNRAALISAPTGDEGQIVKLTLTLPARPGDLPIRRHQRGPAPRRRRRRRQRRPRLPRPPASRPAPTTMREA